MSNFDYFKKNTSSMHYTGKNRSNILNSIKLAIEYINENDNKTAKQWLNYSIDELQELNEKLTKIDKINNLK